MPGAWLGLVRVLPASSAIMGCGSPGRAFANNVGIQKFPKYEVRDPGGVHMHLVSSTETFLSSRVCSWESCDARQAAAHPPGRGRQAWGCRGSWTSPDYTGVISPLLVWIPTPRGTAGLQSRPVPLRCPREGSRGLLGAGAGSSRQFWQEAQLEAPPGR